MTQPPDNRDKYKTQRELEIEKAQSYLDNFNTTVLPTDMQKGIERQPKLKALYIAEHLVWGNVDLNQEPRNFRNRIGDLFFSNDEWVSLFPSKISAKRTGITYTFGGCVNGKGIYYPEDISMREEYGPTKLGLGDVTVFNMYR